jgi:hypothetical protein
MCCGRFTEAASQLEPLAADPRPLVIVLANPRGVIAEVDDHHLIESMYGDLVVRFNVNIETGGPASDPEWVFGGGGGRLLRFSGRGSEARPKPI